MNQNKPPESYSKSYPHRSLAEDFGIDYGDALLMGDLAADRELNAHHLQAVDRLVVRLGAVLFVQMLSTAINIRIDQGVEPWQ